MATLRADLESARVRETRGEEKIEQLSSSLRASEAERQSLLQELDYNVQTREQRVGNLQKVFEMAV
mgnify:CR=1 FL=1